MMSVNHERVHFPIFQNSLNERVDQTARPYVLSNMTAVVSVTIASCMPLTPVVLGKWLGYISKLMRLDSP
jgi:hypothetical protein